MILHFQVLVFFNFRIGETKRNDVGVVVAASGFAHHLYFKVGVLNFGQVAYRVITCN